jgi:integrase
MPLTVLTAGIWRRFEERRLATVPAGDSAKRRSVLVSVNAYARGARSIFQPDFLPWYHEDAGLMLPDLSGFMGASISQPNKVPKLKPSRDLLDKTFKAAVAWKNADEPAYMAWMLAVYSLRAGEVQRCERSWLREEEVEDDADFTAVPVKEWVIRSDAGKSDRPRRIAIPATVATELIGYWERTAQQRPAWDQAFILPAGRPGANSRAQAIIKRARKWMRDQGWTSKKVLHEMRALYLRRHRAQFGKLDEAALRSTADAAGHRDTRTTTDHYTGELSRPGVIVEFPGLSSTAKAG